LQNLRFAHPYGTAIYLKTAELFFMRAKPAVIDYEIQVMK